MRTLAALRIFIDYIRNDCSTAMSVDVEESIQAPAQGLRIHLNPFSSTTLQSTSSCFIGIPAL